MSDSASSAFTASGRRKESVANVRLVPGTGKLLINDRPFDDYFPTVSLQNNLLLPLQIAEASQKFDVHVNARGGGITGQVGAIRLAVSRALIKSDPDLRPNLKKAGLLRRDPRMKERKKSGQPGARKRFQFSKR